jgi:hypothetical protein
MKAKQILTIIFLFFIFVTKNQEIKGCINNIEEEGWCENNQESSKPKLFPDFEIDTPTIPIPFCDNHTNELNIKCEGILILTKVVSSSISFDIEGENKSYFMFGLKGGHLYKVDSNTVT